MICYFYISFGLIGTGLSFYVFGWIRSLVSKKCKCIAKRKKIVVITGATSGLGKHCAYELAKRNCNLILGCRNLALGQKLIDEINKVKPIATMIHLDLSDLDSIEKFCRSLSEEKIDILINNAGVMMNHFRTAQSTETEMDMTVNYLGHFYLTNLLLKNLRGSDGKPQHSAGATSDNSSRIIFISSSLCKNGQLDVNSLDLTKCSYNPMQAYANSKLALCLFARDLHRRLLDVKTDYPGIIVMTMFTGGMVHTGLSRHMIFSYSIFLQPIIRFFLYLLLKHPADVSQSIVHCALSEDLDDSSGKLFANFQKIPWPVRVNEYLEICPDLWNKSCDLVGLKRK